MAATSYGRWRHSLILANQMQRCNGVLEVSPQPTNQASSNISVWLKIMWGSEGGAITAWRNILRYWWEIRNFGAFHKRILLEPPHNAYFALELCKALRIYITVGISDFVLIFSSPYILNAVMFCGKSPPPPPPPPPSDTQIPDWIQNTVDHLQRTSWQGT